MNFILANCKHGQRKIGTELAPNIIYNKLLKNVYKKDLTNNVFIKDTLFRNERGYNKIYEQYNNFNNVNNNPVITLGGDHSVSIGSCQAFIDKYKEDAHIVWVDAHTDINTQETSITGNIHGMVVSQLMGLDKSLIKKGFRVLIRLSGTEPLIRILVEGPKMKEVELIVNILEHKVRSFLD